MRKIILMVLVIVAWEIFPNIGYAQFIDIEKDSLKYMVEHNIIQGYPDQTFKPKNPINRAEFLKIVLESSGIKTETPKEDCFPDISKNEWFAPYICTAFTNGWIQGYPDGTFKPEQTINKVEALKITAKITNWPLPNKEQIQDTEIYEMYSDTPRDAWYSPYVGAALHIGYFDAAPKLEPSNFISREDIAELLFRVILTQKLYQSSFRTVDIKKDLALEADNFFQIEKRIETLTLENFTQPNNNYGFFTSYLDENGWEYGIGVIPVTSSFLEKEGKEDKGTPLQGGVYDTAKRFHADEILVTASFQPGQMSPDRREWYFLGVAAGYTFGENQYSLTTDSSNIIVTRTWCYYATCEGKEKPEDFLYDGWYLVEDPPIYEYHLAKDTLQPIYRGTSNRIEYIKPYKPHLKLAMIALDDNGKSGEKIGCNDSIVMVNGTSNDGYASLTEALNALFGEKDQYYGESGLYNSLYQSNLAVKRIDMGIETLEISLEGTYKLSGACDNARLKAQIEKTAQQIIVSNEIEVVIFINDTNLDELLSGEGD